MNNLTRAIALFAPLLACAALAQSTSPPQDAQALDTSAQAPERQAGGLALTNADVLAMLKAGLPESVLVAKISTATEVRFDTSAQTLVALSQADVPAAVLTAMVQRDSRALARERSLRTQFHGTPCETPGMFVERDDGLHALDVVGPARQSSGGMVTGIANSAITTASGFYIPGFIPRKNKVSLDGAAATLRITEREPTFLLCFLENPQGAPGVLVSPAFDPVGLQLDPADVQLVAFRVRKRKDERQFNIGRESLLTGTETGIPARQLRDVALSEVKPGVYRVRTTQPLKPGEYGFYYGAEATRSAMWVASRLGGRVYAFGVDKS